ncbi:TPA: hypothetical protein EYP38_00995, partial [Candidatus Micrarchaeota archaeon]|nr:hypothetical protein [Candidatus Micrarchaeota archaeon]
MGGKENYAEQTYLLAVTALVFSTFYFPLTVLLEFVPPEAMFLLCLLHLPMAAFAVYSILVLYQMVKAIHP